MTNVYINQIVTAVPDHDVHQKFVGYAPSLLNDERKRKLFMRMVKKSQIEHRYSFFEPATNPEQVDKNDFFKRGAFPGTKARMDFYEAHAFELARRALDTLDFASIKDEITHLIITTCTGFYAPGVDLQIVRHYGLKESVERTIIGFMGCYAAFNALKLARHIVRSEPSSKVAILNLELCTLHLQETDDLEQVLSFLIFADGCSASLVSAQPFGLELQSFSSTILPDSADQITWHIGGLGFDMVLQGRVPQTIASGLPSRLNSILGGQRPENIEHWAIHPGGRTILDAVQSSIGLPENKLRQSRDVLRRFGNMSSATVMFVLKEMMQSGTPAGHGCAMGFGPGLTAESMLFQTEGS
jgi:predicted naringenin-chalcone synthase